MSLIWSSYCSIVKWPSLIHLMQTWFLALLSSFFAFPARENSNLNFMTKLALSQSRSFCKPMLNSIALLEIADWITFVKRLYAYPKDQAVKLMRGRGPNFLPASRSNLSPEDVGMTSIGQIWLAQNYFSAAVSSSSIAYAKFGWHLRLWISYPPRTW